VAMNYVVAMTNNATGRKLRVGNGTRPPKFHLRLISHANLRGRARCTQEEVVRTVPTRPSMRASCGFAELASTI